MKTARISSAAPTGPDCRAKRFGVSRGSADGGLRALQGVLAAFTGWCPGPAEHIVGFTALMSLSVTLGIMLPSLHFPKQPDGAVAGCGAGTRGP